MERLFYLTEKEMEAHPFIKDGHYDLYDFICRKALGVSLKEAKLLNPAKIDCSEDVYDASEAAFAKAHPAASRESSDQSFAMLWANAGPHTRKDLRGPYCIYLHHGAIELEGE